MSIVDDLPEKQEELEEMLEEIAEKHDLQPDVLKKVIKLRAKGHTQRETAEKAGVSATTVRNYENKVKEEFDTNEFVELLTIVGLLLGGLGIASKILGDGS